MLADIKRRVQLAGVSAAPIVLENHTKDLGMLRPVERVVESLQSDPVFEVITLREMAANLRAGKYPIRVAA